MSRIEGHSIAYLLGEFELTTTLSSQAQKLNLKLQPTRPRGSVVLPPLLLLTDDQRLPNPIEHLLALPRGSGVILRNYSDPYRDELAFKLRQATKPLGLKLLVAGDPHLALRVHADGCHLPETQGHLARRAKQSRPNMLVTIAAHSFGAIVKACRAGADAALVSPVFPTKSHVEAQGLGPTILARWVHETPLPLYALGGICDKNAARLGQCGLAGLAGISGFFS